MTAEYVIFDRDGRLYAVWEGGLLILWGDAPGWRAAASIGGRTTIGGGKTADRALQRAIELAALGARRRSRGELVVVRGLAERLAHHARALELEDAE